MAELQQTEPLSINTIEPEAPIVQPLESTIVHLPAAESADALETPIPMPEAHSQPDAALQQLVQQELAANPVTEVVDISAPVETAAPADATAIVDSVIHETQTNSGDAIIDAVLSGNINARTEEGPENLSFELYKIQEAGR